MAMVQELDNQGSNKTATCHNCRSYAHTRYHCTQCEDFDLCIECYDTDGHPHRMEKLGFGLDDGSPNVQNGTTPEARKLYMDRWIQSIEHACLCQNANCRLPSCPMLKRAMQHTKTCKSDGKVKCAICSQFVILYSYHAKLCRDAKCPLPFCLAIKRKQNKSADPESSQKLPMRTNLLLLHASQCQNADCRVPNCPKMKGSMQHIANCKRPIKDGCADCEEIFTLYNRHGDSCQDPKCPVIHCQHIKKYFKQCGIMTAQLLRQRMVVLKANKPTPDDSERNQATTPEQQSADGAESATEPQLVDVLPVIEEVLRSNPHFKVVCLKQCQPKPRSIGARWEVIAFSGGPIDSSQPQPASNQPQQVAGANQGGGQTMQAAGAGLPPQPPSTPNKAVQQLLSILNLPKSLDQQQKIFQVLKTYPQLFVVLFVNS